MKTGGQDTRPADTVLNNADTVLNPVDTMLNNE